MFDLAHARGESKNQVKYNNFTTKSNRDVNISQNTAQNVDEPLCNFCSKRGHTEENCYSKSNSQNPKKMNCSFCGKKRHAIESCYAKNGRPHGNPNQNAGPQPSSTPLESRSKQKRTHQVASVNIIQPSKTNLVFENSSLKSNRLKCEESVDDGDSYSVLNTVQTDTPVFNSCTVIIANDRSHDDHILNPYSKATIGDSDVEHTVLRDSGSFVSTIRKDLVPANCYTNRKVSLQFADGNITTVETALIKINCKFFKGTMDFAILPNPVSPIIIGNMKHVTEDFEKQDKELNLISTQFQTIPTDNEIKMQHEITVENKINKCSQELNKETVVETNEQVIDNEINKHCETNVSSKPENNLLVVQHLNNSPRLRFSEKVVGLKLDKFGGGMIGKRKGSGESDGENLERMRSILSLKNWRNELASDCVSGVSGDELEGLRWRI